MKISRGIKPVCFLCVFLLMLNGTGAVLQDKWPNLTNPYARVRYFYREDPFPDVVFVGPSHVMYHINTLQIFQEEGFTSYDFSSPAQDFSASKLFVEEALRKGPPKVIVVDVLHVTRYVYSEVRNRQCLDPLPLSFNKLKYINYSLKRHEKEEERRENEEQTEKYDSWLSYLFPTLRYHDRWQDLTADDFKEDSNLHHFHGASHYHGFAPNYFTAEADFSHYYDSEDVDESVLAENKRLLSDIVALCKESGTELLLVKTTSPAWRQDFHDLVDGWAKEFGVPFLDYNDLMDEIGIDTSTDFMDQSHHLNDVGAGKLSRHLGRYLQERYSLPDHRGDAAYAGWDHDWDVYQQDKALYFLVKEKDWAEYVEKLKNPHYTIYFAAKDNLGGGSHSELTELLHELGLEADLSGKAQWGYMAVVDGDKVLYEQLSEDALSYEQDINGNHVKLISESYTKGNRASIQINQKEYFVNQRGIGIVVYDNILGDVVDRVTFDFYGGGTAYR